MSSTQALKVAVQEIVVLKSLYSVMNSDFALEGSAGFFFHVSLKYKSLESLPA